MGFYLLIVKSVSMDVELLKLLTIIGLIAPVPIIGHLLWSNQCKMGLILFPILVFPISWGVTVTIVFTSTGLLSQYVGIIGTLKWLHKIFLTIGVTLITVIAFGDNHKKLVQVVITFVALTIIHFFLDPPRVIPGVMFFTVTTLILFTYYRALSWVGYCT